jgi:transcriptional regulator with GAF, ATPase, and Fis domain
MKKQPDDLPENTAAVASAAPGPHAGRSGGRTQQEDKLWSAKDKLLDSMADMIVSFLDQHGDKNLTFKHIMDDMERGVLVKSLNRHNGNQRLAARFLCLKPTTLCAKLRKYRVQIQRYIIDASYPSKKAAVIDPEHPATWGFLRFGK